MDVEKFTKLMKMTTSSHDGEALTAVRMANAMLAKHKLGWDDVFTKVISKSPPSKTNSFADDVAETVRRARRESERRQREAEEDDASATATEIRRMFKYLRTNLEKGSIRDFVASIHQDWLKFHKLTNAQLRGLKRVYKRALKDNGHDGNE